MASLKRKDVPFSSNVDPTAAKKHKHDDDEDEKCIEIFDSDSDEVVDLNWRSEVPDAFRLILEQVHKTDVCTTGSGLPGLHVLGDLRAAMVPIASELAPTGTWDAEPVRLTLHWSSHFTEPAATKAWLSSCNHVNLNAVLSFEFTRTLAVLQDFKSADDASHAVTTGTFSDKIDLLGQFNFRTTGTWDACTCFSVSTRVQTLQDLRMDFFMPNYCTDCTVDHRVISGVDGGVLPSQAALVTMFGDEEILRVTAWAIINFQTGKAVVTFQLLDRETAGVRMLRLEYDFNVVIAELYN